MQNNFVNLANEAINVNTKLFNRSVGFGVESAQQLVQNASEQTSDWLKIKSFDDYVATQENWNSIAIEQTQKATRSAIEFGNEAYSAYLSLWQKLTETAKQPIVTAVEKKKV